MNMYNKDKDADTVYTLQTPTSCAKCAVVIDKIMCNDVVLLSECIGESTLNNYPTYTHS